MPRTARTVAIFVAHRVTLSWPWRCCRWSARAASRRRPAVPLATRQWGTALRRPLPATRLQQVTRRQLSTSNSGPAAPPRVPGARALAHDAAAAVRARGFKTQQQPAQGAAAVQARPPAAGRVAFVWWHCNPAQHLLFAS